jgi:DNA repair protein RadC
VHTHPSLDPTPSPEDMEITRRLVDAGKILGIEVLDHVIVGDHWVSLKERGIL